MIKNASKFIFGGYMCGIIGYTGKNDAVTRVIDGLYRLEYRGYDSAGVAAQTNDGVKIIKCAGRVEKVDIMVKRAAVASHSAIGHTRWATHGAPSDVNSHPHKAGHITLVHNGIIENADSLENLIGVKLPPALSETDSEKAAAAINYYYETCKDPVLSIRKAASLFRGSYAFGIVIDDIRGTIFAAKKSSPLVIGLSDDGNFIASDISAFLKYTKRYIPLSDGDIAVVTGDGVKIFDSDGKEASREVKTATWNACDAERGTYPHFMIKEISEEPDAVRRTLSPRVKNGLLDFSCDGIGADFLRSVDKLKIVACGTAAHAGLMGKYYFEKMCKIPVSVEIASEYRYSEIGAGNGDLVLFISQSGETADTLASLIRSKSDGADTLALVNVAGSSIASEAGKVIYTNAGPEVAVASTKAYTVQSATLFALAARTAYEKGIFSESELKNAADLCLEKLPCAIENIVKRSYEIREMSEKYGTASDMFFIGRGVDYYAAREASLKMKEITYIHSEAYPAGELKHGTISLVTEKTPTFAVMTQKNLYEKTISNVREVMSRGGKVAAVCGYGVPVCDGVDSAFVLPECEDIISPVAVSAVFQLLAYYTAIFLGRDVDKPRNLAKSVTVE